MPKQYRCPCGKIWLRFVHEGESSLCCDLEATLADDGEVNTELDLSEEFEFEREEGHDTLH